MYHVACMEENRVTKHVVQCSIDMWLIHFGCEKLWWWTMEESLNKVDGKKDSPGMLTQHLEREPLNRFMKHLTVEATDKRSPTVLQHLDPVWVSKAICNDVVAPLGFE